MSNSYSTTPWYQSHSGEPFQKLRLEDALHKHELDEEKFHELRNLRIVAINDQQNLQRVINVRREVPPVRPGIILEKIVAPSDIQGYLRETRPYQGIQKFTAKWHDVPMNLNPEGYIRELGLYYPNSPFFNGKLNRVADMNNTVDRSHMVDHVYSIRLSAGRLSSQDYDDEKGWNSYFRVPIGKSSFGDHLDKIIGSFHDDEEPYTGTGHTKSSRQYVIPEFFIDMLYQTVFPIPQPFSDGDEIYLVTNKGHDIVARYTIGLIGKGKWHRLDSGDQKSIVDCDLKGGN